MTRTGLGLVYALLAAWTATSPVEAADARQKVQVFNPVGHFDGFVKIIDVNVPLRGTLREVWVDPVSDAEARRTGELPYGTKIVMKDFVAASGMHGYLTRDHRLVAGKPQVVLVQQKERGWGQGYKKGVRIGEWEFGVFTPAGKPIPVNVAVACMPCHARFPDSDYTFLVHNFYADLKNPPKR